MCLSAGGSYPLCPIHAVVFPHDGIGVNVLPDHPIIRFIPNHMIVERFLPNRWTDFFRNNAFPLLNNCLDRRGDHWSPVGIRMNLQQQVDMVRHYHIMIHRNCRVIFGDIPNGSIYDHPVWGKVRRGRATNGRPYGVPEDTPVILCANGDKISTRCTVIIAGDAVLFPFRTLCFHPFITIARKAWRTSSSVEAVGSAPFSAAAISAGL